MRLAIIGSRSFNDTKLLNETLKPYKDQITLVVSGGAKGADQLGEYWARLHKIETLIFLPDWENLDVPKARIKIRTDGTKYNANAGFDRNKKIVENSDFIIAFWDDRSPGTRNSIKWCKKLKKPYQIIEFKNIENNKPIIKTGILKFLKDE